MRVKFWLLSALLAIAGGSVVAAQNTAQPLQPHGNRVVASLGGGAAPLMPATFSVEFYNDTIVPSIGTAGTHTRSSVLDYQDSASTVTQVASGVPATGAFPFDPTAPAGVTGFFGQGDVRTYLLWNEDFSNVAWVKNGTASVVTDSVVAPDGNSTADTLTGAAANDGIQQATAVLANASPRMWQLAIWLKVSTGTHVVTLKIRGDSGITPEETTKNVTATTTWKPFFFPKSFTAAATGNAEAEIEFNDTSGLTLYAWRPQFHYANSTIGTRWGNICPWTKTEAATVTTADVRLSYAGTELTTGATAGMTYAWWVYYWEDGLAGYNFWPLEHQSGDGDNGFHMNKNSTYSMSDGVYKAYASYLPDQQWTLLEFTIDYTANQTVHYVNGVKTGTHATTATQQSSFTDLQVGSTALNWENAMVFGGIQVYYGLDSDDDALARYEEQKGYFGY